MLFLYSFTLAELLYSLPTYTLATALLPPWVKVPLAENNAVKYQVVMLNEIECWQIFIFYMYIYRYTTTFYVLQPFESIVAG